MTGAFRRWIWLLLCSGLMACATAQPWVGEDSEEQGEIASFEEWCAEEGSLLPLCEGPRCGLYRCREVMERRTVGRVVPALAEEMVLPLPANGAQRYWGSSDGLPESSQPVFIIQNAPKEEIMRYAGQLIYEFELVGPVVPYYRRWTQPPPIGG